jgi:peptidoglycan hydrolase-like protein with peptidoglycan-binding domain
MTVVSFQESQGLAPTGGVDAPTWVLLDNPQTPRATPTPAAPALWGDRRQHAAIRGAARIRPRVVDDRSPGLAAT